MSYSPILNPMPVTATFWQAVQPVKIDQTTPTGPVTDLLGAILIELKLISTLLQVGLAVKDDLCNLRNDYVQQS